MAEYTTIVANYMPNNIVRLLDTTQYEKMCGMLGDNGTMTAGSQSLDGSHAVSTFSLKSPRLTFGGNSSKIGSFEWVQNCTVNGQNMTATAQVTAIVPFSTDFRGVQVSGFAAIVGISYPGGSSSNPGGTNITQDPDISSQAVTNLAASTGGTGTGTNTLTGSFPIGLLVIVLVAAIVVAAVVVIRRNGGGKGPSGNNQNDHPEGDWRQFYEKK